LAKVLLLIIKEEGFIMFKEKKILKDEILLPPFQYRFESVQEISLFKMNPFEINHPIKVVLSKESGKYIPIEGISIYRDGCLCEVEDFTCEIIGEVSYDFDGFIERMKFILKKNKPFHLMEQAKAVYGWIKFVRSKGELELMKYGGVRKGDGYKNMVSVDKLLEGKLPYLEYKIAALRRFVDKVGMIGIEGLFIISEEKETDVHIRHIHSNNGKLGTQHFSNEIEKIQKLEIDDDEIKKRIGLLIYEIIYEDRDLDNDQMENQNDGGTTGSNDDPDDTGSDPDGSDDEDNDEDTPSINPVFKSVNKSGFNKIKKAFKAHFSNEKKIRTYLKPKDCLTDSEAEELHILTTAVQNSFTKFYTGCHSLMSAD
jgi:hypothetical protein